MSFHIGSLITFNLPENIVIRLWSSSLEQDWISRRKVINLFRIKHAVMLLKYSLDEQDVFVLSQFGVGWISVVFMKRFIDDIERT